MSRSKTISAALAVAVAAAILLSTSLAAAWVEHSRIYMQSQMIRSIAGEDGVSMFSIVTSPEKRDVTLRFVAAITNAYINFELIPYNEAQTFTAIFASLNEGIHIETFEYRRHDLVIHGYANSIQNYYSFVKNLADNGRFASVTGYVLSEENNTVIFEVWCISTQTSDL